MSSTTWCCKVCINSMYIIRNCKIPPLGMYQKSKRKGKGKHKSRRRQAQDHNTCSIQLYTTKHTNTHVPIHPATQLPSIHCKRRACISPRTKSHKAPRPSPYIPNRAVEQPSRRAVEQPRNKEQGNRDGQGLSAQPGQKRICPGTRMRSILLKQHARLCCLNITTRTNHTINVNNLFITEYRSTDGVHET